MEQALDYLRVIEFAATTMIQDEHRMWVAQEQTFKGLKTIFHSRLRTTYSRLRSEAHGFRLRFPKLYFILTYALSELSQENEMSRKDNIRSEKIKALKCLSVHL